MRLPNGYGNISKLPGNRRKPWRVRRTSGWEPLENGKHKQIYQIIGYYETRPKALAALAEFNKDPYSIDGEALTFLNVYDLWSEDHFQKLVPKSQSQWVSINKHCTDIHDFKFRDIRVNHLEQIMKACPAGDTTKGRIRNLFSMMYRYAIKHEIVVKNYAEMSDTVKEPKATICRTVFSDDELKVLWENTDNITIKTILISLYSGWRPSEIAELEIKNVDLENKTMMGGLKTEAGINRIVPIHSKIFSLVESLYVKKNRFLITDKKGPVSYDTYYHRFKRVMNLYGFSHSPHDTRHSFVTYAKNANMNEYILKLIIGHSINDITEKVYTHRTLDNLKEEVEKITV